MEDKEMGFYLMVASMLLGLLNFLVVAKKYATLSI